MEKTFYQKIKDLRDEATREGIEIIECLKKLENLLVTNKITSIDGCGIVSKEMVVDIFEYLIPKPMRFSDFYQEVKKECPVITQLWFYS